jgi:hypothetical protein
MSEQESASEPKQRVENIGLAEFLESIPPGQSRIVTADVRLTSTVKGSPEFGFTVPEIQLYCPEENCNGTRFFRAEDYEDSFRISGTAWHYEFVTYVCSNCQKYKKTFSLAILIQTTEGKRPVHVTCHKLGEHPPYGPPTPSRLISLIGPDRELFLKGRRCENQGLGIGAFVYYRRVVEDQKNRIIGEIIKVAETIGAPPEAISALKEAQQEQQFSNAIEKIKSAIPQRLLIDGQNPLSLLHSALSKGLHGLTDEKCLELATDVRLVLAELSELLGYALKDERELKEAVARLRGLPS